jgi:hypothetical protein
MSQVGGGIVVWMPCPDWWSARLNDRPVLYDAESASRAASCYFSSSSLSTTLMAARIHGWMQHSKR